MRGGQESWKVRTRPGAALGLGNGMAVRAGGCPCPRPQASVRDRRGLDPLCLTGEGREEVGAILAASTIFGPDINFVYSVSIKIQVILTFRNPRHPLRSFYQRALHCR